MEFTGERFVPDEVAGVIAAEHLSRYRGAAELAAGKDVLDLACGEGYGSELLARTARSVLGVDISQEAVDHAAQTYARAHLSFQQGSADAIPAPDDAFDLVVSFETIEHVPEEVQQAFLREVRRVLRPGGVFLVSTPDRALYTDARAYHNPFHVKEFSRAEFSAFLGQVFPRVSLLAQGTVMAGGQLVGVMAEHFRLTRVQGAAEEPLLYLVAVCSDRPVAAETAALSSLFVPEADARVPVDLFFDRGQGFSHADKIMASLAEDEDGVYTARFVFENPGDLLRLKFDPLDDACAFSLLSLETDAMGAELSYPHAVRRGEEWLFVDTNPGILIDGQFPAHCHLTMRYRMRRLGAPDFVRAFSGDVFEAESLRAERAQLQQETARLTEELQARDEEIGGLRGDVQSLRGDVQSLREAVQSRDRELADIRTSHAFRLMQGLWRVRDVVIPMNSTRRLFAKLCYKTLTQPRTMLGKLSLENVRKLRRALTEGTPGDVEARLSLHVPEGAPGGVALDLLPLKAAEAVAPLTFAAEEDPCVSIVIPVYNAFPYTYACLASILRHTQVVRYEVIIADDGSTDRTREIERIAEGVRVVRHEAPLRFLRNANAGAREARGKYLVFLNNDTQVQEDWLAPLVRLMEDDDSIGMTGAKLVYPDGRLQEAGGIVWRDASAWNYGHGDDPSAVQYNYVKDVDYISGAAICIRRSLFEALGGFDDRYAPAYYEDTDLAFSVRQCGKRVVYQPQSVVVHFEGISNGTDVEAGLKRYQVENRQKFREKWREVLQRDQLPNGTQVTLARDRSRRQKYILVVDHYVPHYDTDAGGRCSFEYLGFFVRLGLHVVFVGDNYFPHQPYTRELEQQGIEVLCGPGWDFRRFRKWLHANGKYLDYVYLQRPHIAIKYIDLVRSETRAKIIYFGHDIHCLRERRQYEVEKDPAHLKEAEKWEKIETELWQKSDVIHVVGAYEQHLLEERFPGKPVRNIPLYLYDSAALAKLPAGHPAGRSTMIFVGGFNHAPNQDALLWFMEAVYPRVKAEIPDLVFYVVGSHPTEAVKRLGEGRDDVIVTGFVSDARLAELYGQARVNVIPLRYGAGIKGKVIETLYFGVPAVTTPVGAEGLPGVEDCLAIVSPEDASAYAAQVLRLFRDDAAWQAASDAGRAYIRAHFTREHAREVLCRDIDPTEKGAEA